MTEEVRSGGATNPLSEEEILSILHVPAVFVTRFSIFMQVGTIKLAFSEQATSDAKQAVPRCAVVMDMSAAKALRDMLNQMIPADGQ